MKLVSILDENLVVCGLVGDTREELYGHLLDHVQKYGRVKGDRRQLLLDIIEREDALQMPYEGIALPHIRTDATADLTIAIGIPKQPITFKGNDIGPCSIVIMSLIGPSTSDLYLKALAAFSRFLIKAENREKITAAATPADVLKVLEQNQVMLKNEITAEDIMKHDCFAVGEDDQVSDALDAFSRLNEVQLPVVDNAGKIIGVVDAAEIIKRHVPSYIFLMDNLKFLTTFEPFDKIFKEEQKQCVKSFMRPPKRLIPPELPLIQITIALLKGEADLLYVAGKDGKLLGVIGMQQLVHKVLRG
ncbi:MAG: PTS sugar transporter subunit IIA [Victivallales bacterium]|nr:PTS sugar transporter subunit IIA [Victivallales bacterium]